MSLTKTPICDFGKKAETFQLKSTDNKIISLNDIKGDKGTLIMFICNHCPYVKAVIEDIVEDSNKLADFGIKSVAICSNDVKNYPEDSFENMIEFSKENNFKFPYVIDETQEIAKAYHAACTPDFSVFNKKMECVYRGQLDDSRPGNNEPVTGSDIRIVLNSILSNEEITLIQKPSVGCNIKWKEI